MTELLPIVDAHVHLWNPEQFSMPWLADIPRLNRPYGLQDYREQTRGLPIIAMVYVEVGVEPQEALREAHYAAGLAREEALLRRLPGRRPDGPVVGVAGVVGREEAVRIHARVASVIRAVRVANLA